MADFDDIDLGNAQCNVNDDDFEDIGYSTAASSDSDDDVDGWVMCSTDGTSPSKHDVPSCNNYYVNQCPGTSLEKLEGTAIYCSTQRNSDSRRNERAKMLKLILERSFNTTLKETADKPKSGLYFVGTCPQTSTKSYFVGSCPGSVLSDSIGAQQTKNSNEEDASAAYRKAYHAFAPFRERANHHRLQRSFMKVTDLSSDKLARRERLERQIERARFARARATSRNSAMSKLKAVDRDAQLRQAFTAIRGAKYASPSIIDVKPPIRSPLKPPPTSFYTDYYTTTREDLLREAFEVEQKIKESHKSVREAYFGGRIGSGSGINSSVRENRDACVREAYTAMSPTKFKLERQTQQPSSPRPETEKATKLTRKGKRQRKKKMRKMMAGMVLSKTDADAWFRAGYMNHDMLGKRAANQKQLVHEL